MDGTGKLFIADTNNHRIRVVDPSGVITTLAGDGNAGFSGDGGPATGARLNFPTGVFVDGSGNLFFADRENHRVRRVDTSGTITTVAGNGVFGYSGDGGPAALAKLAFPSGVFVDGSGVAYIADRFNFRIRRVSTGGTITTIAGNGSSGFGGDGGPAILVSLAFPSAVYANAAGDLFIADRDNHRIRKVDGSGTITTVVGDGISGFGGDGGAATGASLSQPYAVFGDVTGNLFIADTNNRRIRKVAAPIFESTQAVGLFGQIVARPGEQVPILHVGVTGDGTSSVDGVTITLFDITIATGLTASDFFQLQIFQSADSVLDAGDTLIGSVAQASIQIGSPTSVSLASLPPGGTEWFYIAACVMNTLVTEGHAFRVGFASDGLATTLGGRGSPVAASDGDRVTVDVVATQLLFAVQPAGSVSGIPLTSQPAVTAMDADGNVDLSFSDQVTLSEGFAGTLINHFATPVAGVATFTALTYQATADQEVFSLMADDLPGGDEGDLTAVGSAPVVSDVVATRLVFLTQPGGSVSGRPLTAQPVVAAQDANGLVDTGFDEVVVLNHSSAGTLRNQAQAAFSGLATFTNLTYSAIGDREAAVLAADDQVGGPEGDLPSVSSPQIVSDVLATNLVFVVQPEGSTSGLSLTTQPVVEAQDDEGLVDLDFAETLMLTTGAPGSLEGQSVQASSGSAAFTNAIYRATTDHQPFSLTVDDQAGGPEGDLALVTSAAVISDVVATGLHFVIDPNDVVSGQLMGVQPVVSAQDGDGLTDLDFSEAVTLSVNGPGTLTNFIQTAVSGVATFSNLSYLAGMEDHELFNLTADDQPGGTEGDLTSGTSSDATCDVMATRLAFLTQSGEAISGLPLLTQPVVAAVDGQGITDVEFIDTVTLSADTPGTLQNRTLDATLGKAVFGLVTYTATAEIETFVLKADDTPAGPEGDLLPVFSNPLTAGAGSAQSLGLIFDPSSIPADGTSSKTVGVQVLDADGNRRLLDNETVVTLSAEGSLVGGGTATVTSGLAVFSLTATTGTGPVTITASSPGLGEAGDGFAVTAGPAHHLSLSYGREALSPDGLSARSITIQVLDLHGNLRTQDDSTSVTVSVTGAARGGGDFTILNGQGSFLVTADTTTGITLFEATSVDLAKATGILAVGVVPSDLIVSSDPVGPSEVFRGEEVSVSFDIQNVGPGPTSRPFDVAVYLAGGVDSIRMGEATLEEVVAPDSSRRVTLSFFLPSFSLAALEEAYYWVTKVDAGGLEEEVREDNNVRSGPSVVFPVVSTSVDSLNFGTIWVGRSQTVSFDVLNLGLAPLSAAITCQDSQVSVLPDSVSGLAPGERQSVTVTMLATGTGSLSGALHILSNDPKGGMVVGFSGQGIIPELVTIDFDPAQGNQGETVLQATANLEIPLELYVSGTPEDPGRERHPGIRSNESHIPNRQLAGRGI